MRKIIYLKAKTKNQKRKSGKIISLIFMISGFLLMAIAFYPIVSFNIMIAPRFMTMVKPVPDEYLIKTSPKQGFTGIAKAQEQENSTVVAEDYTKASIWFPQRPAIKIAQQESKNYTLSIPKLKIIDAKVTLGGEDLGSSLIHYGGTAYPGDYGNTVIFGHSVLPYFFNPKDYKTIFSTLPSLSEGDEMFVTYEGITYRYLVEEMRVVEPNDVSILEQRYDDSYISLVTCVPPGTYEKRLWVKSRLTKI
ncbi:MAG: sortase [Patescibacteria group bacterium]|nr:sortase [Patescibacteria group bacterium]